MIDSDGYRPNVGIIISNDAGLILWARRVGQQAWQFPQGGIQEGETPTEALYRELQEEVGLLEKDVDILGVTKGWLKYRLPAPLLRPDFGKKCIGQKQKWFLLRLRASDKAIKLDRCEEPEFDHWRWVSYWYPLREVVAFKKDVYRQALRELSPLLE